jgi:arsenate reductase-like glutaredoxin family protein
MKVQVFGTKKCSDTRKALRFFSERRVEVHFVDLNAKGISRGELAAVVRCVSPEDLIDKEGRLYRDKNLSYIRHDIAEKLLEEPLLLKTPVVRWSGKATAGYAADTWSAWIDEDRKP